MTRPRASLLINLANRVVPMRILSFFFIILVSVTGFAQAHEFWISPQEYRVARDGQLVAHIRVGQQFKGGTYSYLPPKFVRFDLVMGDQVFPVPGLMGDKPALTMAAPAEGLATVVHETTDYLLTYSEAEKFVSFVTHKGFDGVLARHKARGLPETGFRERYSRYGKSLIAVGNGAGTDRTVGLETEIVALANPYTDDLTAGFPVQVFYQGLPRQMAQVEVFEKSPDGTVSVTVHRTDAKGQVVLPVRKGHEYLVDAVVMRELDANAENGPVWESLWASLTFAY